MIKLDRVIIPGDKEARERNSISPIIVSTKLATRIIAAQYYYLTARLAVHKHRVAGRRLDGVDSQGCHQVGVINPDLCHGTVTVTTH